MDNKFVIAKRLYASVKYLERVIKLCYLEENFIPSKYLEEAYSLLMEQILQDIRKSEWDLIPEEFRMSTDMLPDMLPTSFKDPKQWDYTFEYEEIDYSIEDLEKCLTYFDTSSSKLNSAFYFFIDKIDSLIKDHNTSRVYNAIFLQDIEKDKLPIVAELISFIKNESLNKIVYYECKMLFHYFKNSFYKPVLYSTISIIEAVLIYALTSVNLTNTSEDISQIYMELNQNFPDKLYYKDKIERWPLIVLIKIAFTIEIIDPNLRDILVQLKNRRTNIHEY